MSVFKTFRDDLLKVLADIAPAEVSLEAVSLELPRDPLHGDLATNAAMVLAKPMASKPRDIAERIAEGLRAVPGVTSIEVAGPGFINIRLADSIWLAEATRALVEGDAFGQDDFGGGERVNVEYISANPTGPLHVGHCRGAVVGDALANLLAFTGYKVTKEYYINDAGGQIDVLARSVHLRYREALGEDIGKIPEGLYPGDYLKPIGVALSEQHGDALITMPAAEWMPIVSRFTIDQMMDRIREDLAALNIRQEVFFAESSLHGNGDGGRVAETLAELREEGLVYEGQLEPPKNLTNEERDEWEDREQTLFRTSSHGDDTDRPLVKSDGSYTYFASDVAYARDKFERGFTQAIFILGADHSGYVKRLQAVGSAVSGGAMVVDVLLCNLVKLLRDGEPVKMGKRAGNFVTLREVVDEVGPDVVRFMMLMRKSDAPLDFDFAKVTEHSKENPVFYVQYAHARICSVLRNAAGELPDADLSDRTLATADMKLLTNAGEIVLARKIAQFPRLIEQAARAHEPHRIGFYLYDLASSLHAQQHLGKIQPELRFIVPGNLSLTMARLALIRAVATVIAAGLGVVGVTPVEEMR